MPGLAATFVLANFFLHMSATGTLRKCCPWGTSLDAGTLVCRTDRTRTDFTVIESDDTAIGLPKCTGSVLTSDVVQDFRNITHTEDYCIDYAHTGTLVVRCRNETDACTTRPCFRKCKPLGEFYGGRDENGTVPFAPVFYDLATLTRNESVTVSAFGLIFGMDCVGGMIRLDNETSDVNYLGTNGSLLAPGHRDGEVFEQHEFCMEYVVDEGIFAFLCPPVEEMDTDSVDNEVILGLGFTASCICLLATFIVYLCTRKSRSLYGKTFMMYVGCLGIAYFCLAIVHLGNHYLKKETCVFLGYSMLLSFLGTFFWLNIMSIDIWKTFGSLRAAERRKSPNTSSRFMAYSIYAWGLSIAITLVCGMLDALPESDQGIDVIRPDIGVDSCWFSNSSYGMHLFFVTPVSIIIACNVVLYVMTALRCWRVKTEINKLGGQSSRSKGKYSIHREQLILIGKLFIVMGVSWGPEFISHLLPHPLWKITDALNTLLGVFIFVIFILKRKVISNLSQRMRESLHSLSPKAHQSSCKMTTYPEKKMCKEPKISMTNM